jgi:protein-tyrosine phosphatase
MDTARIGVLFVCHANLCRSPLCEGIFTDMVRARGLFDRFTIDSAGCWADGGQAPHPNSVEIAARHGIDLTHLRSRGVEPDDLHRFDHILAMDRANLDDLQRLRRLSAFGPVQPGKAKIRLLRHVVDPSAQGPAADVPDPVRRGLDAYEATFALLSTACAALVGEIVPA